MQMYLDKKEGSLEERETIGEIEIDEFQKRMKQVRLINVKKKTKKK